MESANTVGYTQNALGDTANSQIVCFDGITAGGEIDIQSIVPTVADPTTPLESYQASIMTLTPYMATDATYVYMTAADAPDGLGAGWFDESGSTRLTGANAVTFDPGIGFVAINDYGDGLSFQYAGQVAEGATIVELGDTANSCGNNSLSTIDIQDIQVGLVVNGEGNLVLTDGTDTLESYQISIMTLTPYMATDATYVYMTAADAPDGLGAGWFDESGSTRLTGANAVTFDPGVGFFVINDFGDGAKVKIPGNTL